MSLPVYDSIHEGSLILLGRKHNWEELPQIINGDLKFGDKVNIGEISKLKCVQEIYGDLDISTSYVKSFRGIGNKTLRLIDGNLFTNTAVDSNILGVLLIRELKYFFAHNDRSLARSTGNVEPFEIVNRYIADGSRDIFECQIELIDKGYESFAHM